jgi:CheY-like chemotaxis protein
MNTRMPRDSGRVVLLVQPDDDSREMYTEFLRHHGLACVAVSDGADALKAAPHATVVVTGIHLSGGGIDGVELIARLRRDARTKHTPIIVLTACVLSDDRQRAEHAGCDLFLPKPCLPGRLLREVRRMIPRQIRGRPARASTESSIAHRHARSRRRPA